MKHKKSTLLALLIVFIIILPYQAVAEDMTTEVLVVVKADEIMAFSALQNQWVSQSFQLREKVIEKQAHGNVAIVFTNKRILGLSAFTAEWDEISLKMNEHLASIQSDGNVATIETDKRVFAFNAHTGRFVEAE